MKINLQLTAMVVKFRLEGEQKTWLDEKQQLYMTKVEIQLGNRNYSRYLKEKQFNVGN